MLRLPTKISTKFSVEKAHAMQLRLSKRVIKEDLLSKTIHFVAGVDVAYTKIYSVGAVVVLDYASLSVVETKSALVETRFPYIPTLLSFREVLPSMRAIAKLKMQPDVFLVDGQGIAHPYRLGFASHLGLVLHKPTIGVAKSLLCGQVESFDKEWAPITDKAEIIGAAVAKKGRKPIYVSIGHEVSLETAMNIVMHCTVGHRIPEPIRVAHAIANEEKKKLSQRRGQAD